ncbi:hypothetical protein CPJCM30710_19680 [Clostridium polyendosporum]|uniref:Uncharacterized protein n=1 Tax=Clostridium polyendosporum TaxID=69208 RepID=A0A919RZY8_9CLOT|nr:hypothetical protein [Clostridium polyendosporum]GIM29302.1 hypothetical protein CPJCM30710_19680 [Clostridium polyendosporum]
MRQDDIFNNIKVPQDLDVIVKKAINDANKQKKKNNLKYKKIASFLAIFMIGAIYLSTPVKAQITTLFNIVANKVGSNQQSNSSREDFLNKGEKTVQALLEDIKRYDINASDKSTQVYLDNENTLEYTHRFKEKSTGNYSIKYRATIENNNSKGQEFLYVIVENIKSTDNKDKDLGLLKDTIKELMGSNYNLNNLYSRIEESKNNDGKQIITKENNLSEEVWYNKSFNEIIYKIYISHDLK